MSFKQSVSMRVANYLIVVIAFMSVIASLSLAIIASNRSYAEVINVSGSLRMQSYRLLYQMEVNPLEIDVSLDQYQASLHDKSLEDLKHQWLIPPNIKKTYEHLLEHWQMMETLAREKNVFVYRESINSYVSEVNDFVMELQKNAERKWNWAITIILFSMLLIAVMVAYVIWYLQKEVVSPLRLLTKASTQVQMGQFNHVALDLQKDDELGILARAFSKMSSELSKLYMRLEDRVNEKTQKLRQTNRSLSSLYYCSQVLTTNSINEKTLRQILQHILVSENLQYVQLDVEDLDWQIQFGMPQAHLQSQQLNVELEGHQLGVLYWQAGLPCPDLRTMENLARMISRSLYFQRTQRQQEQLLLMEERSTIARELHDSLAQVLSFLQIQLTLLKHNLNNQGDDAKQKSLSIISNFEQTLSYGYSQLRELLATFRLSVQEADLQVALEQVIESLRAQTDIQMAVNSSLPSQSLNAQQLVNVLQIVREAVSNAIKHSNGSLIEVITQVNPQNEYEVIVRDNGVGIASLEEPAGHYGLSTMQERTHLLNAKLNISKRETGGTEVKLTMTPPTIE